MMWLDEHPYVLFYVVGCIATLFLNLFKIVLFFVVGWITKENILVKNINKIKPPNEESFMTKAGGFVSLVVIEAILSWINVPVVLWQIVMGLLRVARELITSVPEEIKLLRFPLRNNPHMSREAVWAHLTALGLKSGAEWNERIISDQLNELVDYYPTFDCAAALKALESLKVVNSEIINGLREWFEEQSRNG